MASSKLQSLVSTIVYSKYSQYEIRENYRPTWLISDRGTRLELDFYMEDIKVAIEVQGSQHYVFVKHFHKTYAKFKQYQADDQYKKDYCMNHGIFLIEISTESDIDDLHNYMNSILHPVTTNGEITMHNLKDTIGQDKFIRACSHLMEIYNGKSTPNDDSEIHFYRFIREAELDENILPEWEFIVFLSKTFSHGEKVGCLTRRFLKKNPLILTS